MHTRVAMWGEEEQENSMQVKRNKNRLNWVKEERAWWIWCK
jgi:hypothetical protein